LNSADTLTLAQQIAIKLGASQKNGTLQTNESTPAPVTNTDGQFVLLSPLDTGKTINTSTYGYDYVSDQVGGNTLFIGPKASLIAGGSLGDTIFGGGGDTIAAGGGNNVIVESSLAGATYDIVTGIGNSQINASGSGTVTDGAGINTIYVSGPGTANIVSNGSDIIGADAATVNASVAGSHTVLFGDFNAGDPQNTVNVTITGVDDTVSGGNSSVAVTIQSAVGGSDALIFGGSGSGAGPLSVEDDGGHDTISAGSSQADVSLQGSKALVFGDTGSGNAALNVTDNGSNDTISAVNSDATVTQGPLSSNLLVFGGSGGLTFLGQGQGSATVIGGSGGITSVTGGSGNLVFFSGSTDATVDGGSGGSTLFGASGQSLTYTNTQDGTALYQALGGNETVNASGSNGNDTFWASTTGNDSILGGTGNDTLFAGTGNDTLGASPGGSDQFWFLKQFTTGQQTDVITGFNANYQINISGYSYTEAYMIDNATSSGGNTTIALSDGTHVTFLGVSDKNNLQGHLNT
jgi:hypothetical protein